MNVTQKTIAQEAGVTQATVSYVINDVWQEKKINADVAEKIKAIAERLGYHQNHAARSLRTKTSRTLGVITYGRLHPNYQFFVHVTIGIQQAALNAGYDLIQLNEKPDPPLEKVVLDYINSGRIDGLAIACNINRVLENLVKYPIPMVAVAPVSPLPFPSVRLDEYAGVRKAVDHLLSMGHRDLLWIGGAGVSVKSRRRMAFDDTCMAAGVRFRHIVIPSVAKAIEAPGGIVETIYHALAKRFPRTDIPTGVVCFNDRIAMALLILLRDCGIRVPEEVSVIGFDDMLATYTLPPLTSVSHMFMEMGQQAVDMLMHQIDGTVDGGERDRHEWLIEPEIVFRRSTGPAPKTRQTGIESEAG